MHPQQRREECGVQQHTARVARRHRLIDDARKNQRARRDREAPQQRQTDARRQRAAGAPEVAEEAGGIEWLDGHAPLKLTELRATPRDFVSRETVISRPR